MRVKHIWVAVTALLLALAVLPVFAAEEPPEDPLIGETGWGQACVRAMLLHYEGKLQVGMVSGGELSALGISPKVGEIPDWDRLKDLMFVQVEISGKDLLTALERSVKYHPRKNANLLHLQGVKVLCARSGETNKILRATIDGKPIEPDKIYDIAATQFLAEGGGPFVGLKSLRIITKTPNSLAKQLRFLLFPRGKVAPPEPSYVFSAGE